MNSHEGNLKFCSNRIRLDKRASLLVNTSLCSCIWDDMCVSLLGQNKPTWSHNAQRVMPSVTSVLLVSPAMEAWVSGTSCVVLADVTDRRASAQTS